MSYNLTGAAYGGNVALGAAGLAATNVATTYSTATAFSFAVKGQLYSKGVVGATALPTVDGATAKPFVPLQIGESCIFAFFINAAGTVSVAQGPKVATLDYQGGLAALQFPQRDDTVTPFGYMIAISTAAAVAPWTFGTNNNTGVTGVSVTAARDVMDYPAQPITG
jgi:hypothetical protein